MTYVIRDRDMALNSSERKKILFVDDDSDITTISKAALERNGFEVQTFVSSLSALENFKPGSYDLLVVDIKMRYEWLRTL
jgi:DNA-binding NtrC family response regulator